MASRPQSTSLRKSLLVKSPSRAVHVGERQHDATVSSSSSAIADSPRRLLSYYLSKAAYNIDESETARTPPNEMSAVQRDGEQVMQNNAVEPLNVSSSGLDRNGTPHTSSSAKLLRPPPFSRSAFSNGLRAGPVTPSVRALQTPPPVMQQQRPSSLSFAAPRDDAEAMKTNVSAPFERVDDARSTLSFKPAPFEIRAKYAQLSHEDEEKPVPTPSLETQHPAHTASATPPAFTSCGVIFTEEQQRQFEAEIMNQVDALLQAQRSETYAELEAYRVTAEEAQTTLRVVENALSEQLGSAAAARFASQPRSALPPGPRNTTSLSSPPLDVERLAVDMSRAAAAAAPTATQQLLDAIMNIGDDQDVPSVLLEVVQDLYNELTETLVLPVMSFIKLHQQQEEKERPSAQSYQCHSVVKTEGPELSQSEELLEAHAEVSALREEVATLRRTLENQGVGGCMLPSKRAPASQGRMTLTSCDTARHGLLDRFFTECHATLTRSRQECLALRRTLEEERRRHFLTRIHLLKPAPSSLAATPFPADVGAIVQPPAPGKDQEGASSPIIRSTTASQDRRVASADRQEPSPPCVARSSAQSFMPASAARDAETQTSPHRWTPAQSPVHLAIDAKERESSRNCCSARSEDSDSAVPIPSPSANRLARTRRVSVSQDGSAQSALRSALRVAEEVLRTTSKGSVTGDLTEHRYYNAYSNPGSNGDNTTADNALHDRANTAAFESEDSLMRRRIDRPPMSFLQSKLNDSHAASRTSYSSELGDSIVDASTTHRGGATGRQGNNEHERRVWGKAVELLRRYSIA